ncbi:laccase [Nocardioides silvaticus]|uniref:Laccase n=1 Tax=Nocardioides silvaticus TaxID=2201891 RepID=A0A316TN38_9ACTN|nr:polyphenol oxidase family protein [Nocardioides silvaticus]PWN03584.1 laccase [Nocardioides silvaticus]
MFAFRDTCTLDPAPADAARVEVAFTDASLDLREGSPGFEPGIAALVEATGVPFARIDQVHGDDVHVVAAAPGADVAVADALVTAQRGVGLMVRVADCVPVLLADPGAGVVGAAHAGRAGVALGVIGRAVERMRELGAEQTRAWIGPHVCGRCYEVPATLRDEVAAAVPETRSETSWGTPALDLGAGVLAQLAAADVPAVTVGRCTLEDEQLHSYRRDGGDAGRLAGLVWIP